MLPNIRLFILCVLIISIVSASGCLEWFAEEEFYELRYFAEYDSVLNESDIIQTFKDNNITMCKFEGSDYLYFKFGKDVNNETIETTIGVIGYMGDPPIKGLIDLGLMNRTMYPIVKNRERLESRKPVLEKAMNYIINLIHNVTGMNPCLKYYDVLKSWYIPPPPDIRPPPESEWYWSQENATK